jgi:anti-anti-sigma factor
MEHVVDGATLRLAGHIDGRCTAEVRQALYELLQLTDGDVHVDLTAVESIDLTALKVLAVANRTAERQGRRIVLAGCPPVVRRMLHLSHLRWMIQVAPTGQDAV